MKVLVLVALVALVSAVDEKKPLAEKKEDKKEEQQQQHGLVWPLPDPHNEGDLMLHGAICYDRIQALHKQKVEDVVDKVVLHHGRQFLSRVAKFFDVTNDFKIIQVLCRDSRNLNSTNDRWEIEIQKQQPLPVDHKPQQPAPIQNDAPAQEKKEEKADDVPRRNNETEINSSSPVLSQTTKLSPVDQIQSTFQVQRREFYQQVGANFARLLMREYRKEQLSAEESEYLARWLSDEAVHYGAMAIYCNEGENENEIKKQLATYLNETNTNTKQ